MQLKWWRGRDVTEWVVNGLGNELGVEGVECFAERGGPARSMMGRGRVVAPAARVPVDVEGRRPVDFEVVGVVAPVAPDGVVGGGAFRK